jgi:hypothetical protein
VKYEFSPMRFHFSVKNSRECHVMSPDKARVGGLAKEKRKKLVDTRVAIPFLNPLQCSAAHRTPERYAGRSLNPN